MYFTMKYLFYIFFSIYSRQDYVYFKWILWYNFRSVWYKHSLWCCKPWIIWIRWMGIMMLLKHLDKYFFHKISLTKWPGSFYKNIWYSKVLKPFWILYNILGKLFRYSDISDIRKTWMNFITKRFPNITIHNIKYLVQALT